jgi:hypothetical protein
MKLYPSGNSYTLFLQTPVRNVTQVDLVSAKIPNTIYNLTSSSNILQINGTSNIYFNAGFYSTITLVSAFNDSSQVSDVYLTYIESRGCFIFTGSITSINILTKEASEIFGLPVGITASVPITNNVVYKGLFPTATNYVVSSNIVSLEINDYVWLDIAEFRTSLTSDARKLVLQPGSNVYTTLSNTSARSFAIIPMDVSSGVIKSFKESSDYPIKVEFPSRIDSLDRLTIQWIDKNGIPLNFRGLDVNSFILRIHTITVPTTPERPESLPPPVPYEQDRQKVIYGAMLALFIGLMLILITGKRR